MGRYLNPESRKFEMARDSEIYVDKSELISYLNSVAGTMQKYVCVSRPHGFGKSMAADMISAYYDRTTEVKELFTGLKIEQDESFEKHANKYDVIALDMQEFLNKSDTMDELVMNVKHAILDELIREYPDIDYLDKKDLGLSMKNIFIKTRRKFVIVIDDWDAIYRGKRIEKEERAKYLRFLGFWLKDSDYVALAYMTGIFPIKEYEAHSSLNMFDECSMTGAYRLAEFMGFTEKEVKELCEKHHMSFEEAKAWYDGYRLEQTLPPAKGGRRVETIGIYSPISIARSMSGGEFAPYWNQTESHEVLRKCINMDIEGLHNAIADIMAGGHVKINIRMFTDDIEALNSVDAVLTLLVHLGYLGYDAEERRAFMPNNEVRMEYVKAMEDGIEPESSGEIVPIK